MISKSSSPGKYKDQTWPALGSWSQDFCSSYWACHHFQKVNRKQSHLNHWDYQVISIRSPSALPRLALWAMVIPSSRPESTRTFLVQKILWQLQLGVAEMFYMNISIPSKIKNNINHQKSHRLYLKKAPSPFVTGVSVAWLGSFWFCAQGWQKCSNGKKVLVNSSIRQLWPFVCTFLLY